MDGEYDIGDAITLEGLVGLFPTRGSIERDSVELTVAQPTGWQDNDPILVAGAGPLGSDLVTTVASRSGHVFTLALPAATSVIGGDVAKLMVATVELTVRQPTLGDTDLSPAPVSVGRYQATFLAAEPGEHFYRFGASGSVAAQGERRFNVRERRVP